MNHDEFILALGNGTKVARWLSERSEQKIDREAVYKWRVNDVPLRWRPLLAKMADEKRVPLPPGFLAWAAA